MTINHEQAQNAVRFAVRQALEAGADEAAASLEYSNHLFTRFARNHIIQNMERNSVTLHLAVSLGKKECVLAISGYEPDSIINLVRRCVENSRFFYENEEHLAPVSITQHRSVNALDESILAMTPIELAENVARVCRSVKKQDLNAYGTHWKFHGMRAIANSADTEALYDWSKAGWSLTVKTADGRGSGREEQESFFLKDMDPDRMVTDAVDTALRSKDPIELPPGDYTVILSPQAGAAYLAQILFAFDARMITEGRSVFAHLNNGDNTALMDKQLFSSQLQIISVTDDPHYPVAPFNPAFSFDFMGGQSQAARMFSNGLPTENRVFVDRGRLENLFYSHYWAFKNNVQPIGHPSLISFKSLEPEQSVSEMIASTERGIFINSLWYIRLVDANNLLLTGLTRDGTFLIENGTITRPVKNFRFNESPFISLGKIQAMSEPQLRNLWMQMVLMPAMKISDFTFSSISEAI
ncbi:TldD/PmbA family protein [bacterium]|nr:TldD/PmbA family protein [bacterium]